MVESDARLRPTTGDGATTSTEGTDEDKLERARDRGVWRWLDAAEGFGGAPALGALMAGLRRAAAAPGAHATSGL